MIIPICTTSRDNSPDFRTIKAIQWREEIDNLILELMRIERIKTWLPRVANVVHIHVGQARDSEPVIKIRQVKTLVAWVPNCSLLALYHLFSEPIQAAHIDFVHINQLILKSMFRHKTA